MSNRLPAGPETIARAAKALERGELVSFPTETVYGLGADASNEAAIAEVYRLKGRPSSHPLIVHLPSRDHLWRWADKEAQAATGLPPEQVEAVVGQLWPGPVTFVLRANARVSPTVTGSQDTVALRVPGNQTALALLDAFGGAVVAPSANRFGYVSPTTAAHVASEFPGDLLVIDDGPTEFGLESTIVDLSSPRPRLLRPGAMPVERIEAALGVPLQRDPLNERGAQVGGHQATPAPVTPVVVPGVDAGVLAGTRPDAAGKAEGAPGTAVPRVPGSLEKHYAPNAPVRIVGREQLAAAPAGSGVIARSVTAAGQDAGSEAAAAAGARVVALPGDPLGFAAGLYAALRELDAAGVSEILVERAPAGDDWLAIRDRLQRAAAGSSEPRETPVVAIVMGSASDWETMRHADELLDRFEVPHSCQVVSAHRTPARMAAFAAGAADAGYKVIIAGAGGAAHLPGMIAAQTHLPVLGVPVQSSALNGVDSLLSQVQMPRGVPVGTLAIGAPGALNAALLAVAILALGDEGLERTLVAYRERQTEAATLAELPTPNFEP